MSDARSRLLQFLRPGERLLWVGQPDPGVRFTGADLFLVPFSLLWGGFAVFWELQAITGRAPFFFVLWGIPFVLIGLYFIFGRFIYKRRRKLTTVYGLTDRRAIISTSERSFADVPINGSGLRIDRSRDGRHVNVFFGNQGGMFPTMAYQNTGLDFFNFGQGQSFAFFDVADPDPLMRTLDHVHSD